MLKTSRDEVKERGLLDFGLPHSGRDAQEYMESMQSGCRAGLRLIRDLQVLHNQARLNGVDEYQKVTELMVQLCRSFAEGTNTLLEMCATQLKAFGAETGAMVLTDHVVHRITDKMPVPSAALILAAQQPLVVHNTGGVHQTAGPPAALPAGGAGGRQALGMSMGIGMGLGIGRAPSEQASAACWAAASLGNGDTGGRVF